MTTRTTSEEPEQVSASGGIRTKLTDEYHDELVKLGLVKPGVNLIPVDARGWGDDDE